MTGDEDAGKPEDEQQWETTNAELTPFQRVIINAVIIAGITLFSTLSISYPPSAQNLWAAFIAAMLSLLTQLKTITDVSELKPKRPLGMLI